MQRSGGDFGVEFCWFHQESVPMDALSIFFGNGLMKGLCGVKFYESILEYLVWLGGVWYGYVGNVSMLGK